MRAGVRGCVRACVHVRVCVCESLCMCLFFAFLHFCFTFMIYLAVSASLLHMYADICIIWFPVFRILTNEHHSCVRVARVREDGEKSG